ncbi:Predicted choloylglycine hydrolase [Anaerosphaera aminiphila DSM 21120]|uniref:Predicted choloylglycine hydrolase n=1 Tax=Anaerosphaera aminiphila DSM 21120 TaxID=1120995 RepID=A0A1M5TCH3_9FIRM|nr:C45 family peptidase [Anaerosphaera aminiphila]SHH48404.1 Predicted choloylglycine hydrolase [Anaerosphaera aminiphila DSM 21120]
MYHLKFSGSHYEIGYKFGERLKKNNVEILNNVPFPIGEERVNFALKSEVLYKKYYPEILEEIKGISDGQSCSYEELIGVLFSMYSIMPSANCSCFVARGNRGIILGRNSDFLTEIEKLYMNTIYKFSGNSLSFMGNTTAFVEIEDGINERGLAIGLTSVAPKKIDFGLNAGMILRLILEKCSSVDEAVDLLNNILISSSQTFVIADKSKGVLVECNCERVEVVSIKDVNFAYSTNMFNLEKMKEYNNLPKENWFAVERYETMDKYFKSLKNFITLNEAKSLLSGEEGFICQYDRREGRDTVWSVIYDLSDNSIYRVEGNPSRKEFKRDERFIVK